uniref:Uncharacterized protein n=1 Tax=Panagrolaimus sp. PS1159 TaxID=55785 RepID=A0AC35GCV3_9BILA
MSQRYNVTVPTGRQSPLSAANSSASDTSVLSTSSKRQQPSSSNVSIQHPRGRVNPFKFSLDLVVNVQPMDNNGRQQRLNGNVTSTPATNVKQNTQHSSLNGPGSTVSAYHRDDNYGPFTSFTGPGTPANVCAAQSSSRSSQASLKDKRKIQTTGNRRYKNKKSLLSCASFKKPRSKSTGTALPGFKPYPRPQPLNFNESDRSDDVSENETVRSYADETFPLVEAKSQDSFNDKNGAVTDANKWVGASVTSTPVPVESKAPVYNHQRQVRIGFIMNGVQTAVNCMVNIRSNDEILYVEPVELLFEGEKMWRRPVRQVVKEMEEKIAADKKNQLK